MCNNPEYFTELYKEIESGEYDRAFYDYFMSLDLENYNFIKERPQTLFYDRMKDLNIPIMAQFLENLIDLNTNKAHLSYSSSKLFSLFNEYVEQNKFKYECSSTRFGIDIKTYQGIEKNKCAGIMTMKIDITTLKTHLKHKYKITFENDNAF